MQFSVNIYSKCESHVLSKACSKYSVLGESRGVTCFGRMFKGECSNVWCAAIWCATIFGMTQDGEILS